MKKKMLIKTFFLLNKDLDSKNTLSEEKHLNYSKKRAMMKKETCDSKNLTKQEDLDYKKETAM